MGCNNRLGLSLNRRAARITPVNGADLFWVSGDGDRVVSGSLPRRVYGFHLCRVTVPRLKSALESTSHTASTSGDLSRPNCCPVQIWSFKFKCRVPQPVIRFFSLYSNVAPVFGDEI